MSGDGRHPMPTHAQCQEPALFQALAGNALPGTAQEAEGAPEQLSCAYPTTKTLRCFHEEAMGRANAHPLERVSCHQWSQTEGQCEAQRGETGQVWRGGRECELPLYGSGIRPSLNTYQCVDSTVSPVLCATELLSELSVKVKRHGRKTWECQLSTTRHETRIAG